MLLRALTLKNIRSYVEERLEFPDGSLLLSGDIGSGKSTILLAIEFALFGVLRGMTDGSMLLRNGANTGQVILECTLNGHNVTISRHLKRAKQGITQDKCSITIGNAQEECTPTQLKAKVLELLGYPPTASAKSLIFRYTVFTSQEEMKAIITEDAKTRLDTLRTLFGIDRYKQITENSQIVLTRLRDNTNRLEGEIQDLPALQEQKKAIIAERDTASTALAKANKQLAIAKEEQEQQQSTVSSLEKEVTTLQEKAKDHAILTSKREDTKGRIEEISKEIDEIDKRIADFKSQEPPPSVEEKDIAEQELTVKQYADALQQSTIADEQARQTITHLQKEMDKEDLVPQLEQREQRAKEQLKEIEQQIEAYQRTLDNAGNIDEERQNIEREIARIQAGLDAPDITEDDTCPVCEQPLSQEHKTHITTTRNAREQELKETLAKAQQILEENTKKHQAMHAVRERHLKATSTHSEIKATLTHLADSLEQARKDAAKKDVVSKELAKAQQRLKESKTPAAREALKSKEEELETLRKKAAMHAEYLRKAQDIANQQERKAAQQELITTLTNAIEEMNKRLADTQDAAQRLEKTSHLLTQEKQRLAQKQEAFTQTSAQVSATKSALEQLNKQTEQINSQIIKREQAQQRLKRTRTLTRWTKEFFLPLVANIEKHVLASIYQEFDSLFRKWFDMLVDDDTLSAKLDIQFTPLIQQNGYDADVNYLSGGERTCVALAYRLALNKVVNDIIETIHTRDLLILDEPTDGFSTEQLDRVRDVLEQLNLRQLIIVSHEEKLETFVEHIMKVQKAHHESHAESIL